MSSSTSPAIKLCALPILASRLARYVARERVPVVMSHLFRANFVNILSRVLSRSRHRTILVNHTRVSRLSTEGLQGRINWTLCRRLYPKADLVASVSAGATDECSRLLSLPQEKAVTLYDAIDVAASTAAAASTGPADAIVAVGRLVRLKRFCDIIDAFDRIAADYPGLELRIVGEGPERAQLERRASACEASNRIRFLGHRADPMPDVAGCRVFVSASETEGFGMAIVEALAARVPVVASDCAFGPREILSPSTDPTRLLDGGAGMEIAPYGILFSVGSVDALEGGLRRVLGDPVLRAHLADRGPQRASDFSTERASAAYERLLFAE